MFKITACLTMATLVNMGFATDKALAQLSPQQCHNAHVQIFNAYIGSGIPNNPSAAQRLQNEMMKTTRQFYAEYPECEENINYGSSTNTNWRSNDRDRRHLEYMREYSNQQVENFKNIMDLME